MRGDVDALSPCRRSQAIGSVIVADGGTDDDDGDGDVACGR
ncbi:MAG TPA: hypothetical protein VGF99_13980 [Myxococcota bacterium]